MKDADVTGRLKIGSEAIGKTKADAAIKKAVAGLVKRAKERERERNAFRDQRAAEMRTIERALEKLISTDEAAKRAMAKLREFPIEGKVSFAPAYNEALGPVHPESLFGAYLYRNVHVIGPPYDYGWEWGHEIDKTFKEPATGDIAVYGNSRKVEDCAAGIGIVLATDKPAIVSVRPYIHGVWRISMGAAGVGAWADARGGFDAAALVEGVIIEPPGIRWNETFAWHQPSHGHKDSESDTVASVSALALSFSMVPGKVYSVNFGA